MGLIPADATFAAPARKCCSDCALRAGSRERSDPWEWLMRAETWADGGDHVCHKTIPGHPGFDPSSGRPDYQRCAGHAAMQGKPLSVWLRLAGRAEE